MAIKLGTMLIQEGLLSLDQLDEALKYQTIFGGKLGTNLIEMGLVNEDDIARVLSNKLRVPYASSDQLLNIPTGTIRLISRDLAAKYRAVPYRQEKKRLHLVMTDPSDLRAVDEIGFITGYAIRPMVAPEVSLVLALEKHYKVERDTRYIPVINQVLQHKGLLPSKAGDKTAAFQGKAETSDDHAWRENIAKYSVDQLSRALADVRDRGQVADLILEYVGRDFEKTALFLIKGQVASGWQARVREHPLTEFDKFSVSLEEPSVLKTVVESKSFYLGPPPDTAANNRLLHQMHDTLPEATLLIPIVKQNRVLCILYVTGDASKLTGEFFELQKILQKASLALDILVLKNKIIMT